MKGSTIAPGIWEIPSATNKLLIVAFISVGAASTNYDSDQAVLCASPSVLQKSPC